jgi:hypothetical protein
MPYHTITLSEEEHKRAVDAFVRYYKVSPKHVQGILSQPIGRVPLQRRAEMTAGQGRELSLVMSRQAHNGKVTPCKKLIGLFACVPEVARRCR